MAKRINELRRARSKATGRCTSINDKAASEGRALSDEEKTITKYMNDFHQIGDDIKREEELVAEERAMAGSWMCRWTRPSDPAATAKIRAGWA